jgi:tetratricopeptide (TPR) repeat protein
MHKKKILYILFLSFYFSNWAIGQKTLIYTESDKIYKDALDLFDKEKYGAAAHQFQNLNLNGNHLSSEVKDNAEYYDAACDMELFHPTAEYKLNQFIVNHPENSKIPFAQFRLGKLYFRQKSYRKAIEHFEKTDPIYLSLTAAQEYYFKLGFSYFSNFNYEKANKAFAEIKDMDTKYSPAANYYSSHIAYLNKNYETALKGFMKLKDSEVFSKLVPYYVVQIYYLQKKFDDLLKYAIPILDSLKPQNEAEINHIIGDAYYKKSSYKEAIPYLEAFQNTSPNTTRDDQFVLGYALYKTENFNTAIPYLEKISEGTDSLTQNALYILADCFLRTSKKPSARNAFLAASKMPFNTIIQEDAFYNYAKLSYELSSQPMAVFAFQDYIKKYPKSQRLDEINELLAQAFLTTKNYKEALVALEKINNKSEKVKAAYQRASFYRALELYYSNDYAGFITLINQSLGIPIDKKIEAQCYYWLGEVYYKKNNFDAAIKNYTEFLFHPKAINMPFYNNANYNIGYCHFKLEDYPEATVWFRKYLKNNEETDKMRANDANLRIGDAYYVAQDFSNALTYYDQAIGIKAESADYALYQKGLIYGLQGKQEEKVKTLAILLTKYKKSKFQVASLYETAEGELLMDNTKKALEDFQLLVNTYPNSDYVKKALVKIGLAYYTLNEDKKALETYKEVISKYPSTPEARAALIGVKTISVEIGDPSQYLNLSVANVSQNAQDSILYESAQIQYGKGDCEGAIKNFDGYLEKFKEGTFSLQANYYKAECELKLKNTDKALVGYDYIASKPKNPFTEKAALTAADIYFKQKQYTKALAHYIVLEQFAEKPANILEAYTGQMRCNALLGRMDSAVLYSKKLLGSAKVSNEVVVEAHFTLGKAALLKDSLATAQKEFMLVYKNHKSEIGAEAKYNIANIQFKQKKYAESQKTIFEIINQLPSYDFWIAKSFILLADTYVETNDFFQAKQTLKSIIDNYERERVDQEDLKALAKEKLDKIQALETQKKELELKEKQEKEEKARIQFEESNKIADPAPAEPGINKL